MPNGRVSIDSQRIEYALNIWCERASGVRMSNYQSKSPYYGGVDDRIDKDCILY